MQSNHTPEPWIVSEESFDNDGIKESVIRGMDGRAAIAVTLDFGANNPSMREANARRIVAAINAFSGTSTEHIEQLFPFGIGVVGQINAAAEKFTELKRQRDGLLSEVERLIASWNHRALHALPADAMLINKHTRELQEAIAKAEGGAA